MTLMATVVMWTLIALAMLLVAFVGFLVWIAFEAHQYDSGIARRDRQEMDL
jgi:hypothetical protein